MATAEHVFEQASRRQDMVLGSGDVIEGEQSETIWKPWGTCSGVTERWQGYLSHACSWVSRVGVSGTVKVTQLLCCLDSAL